jgi:hypothetical protein
MADRGNVIPCNCLGNLGTGLMIKRGSREEGSGHLAIVCEKAKYSFFCPFPMALG